ncbi:CBO0543 family protein [Alkalihalobacillus sp. AL-G]|uniref:CBO0543 family protein n=1 Tax=Alkalihalobacillus sp. AL-G TaxID=2926399 RepID=UPI00272BE954|nr:CBO0543 family protein [Alkalihalobacillus sp. AL-G]WLD92764.1 hypothetical protein MOJ78_17400 [Alkalihalobacillus sp. AL-G]
MKHQDHIQDIVDAQQGVIIESLELWREHGLFSPNWWLLLTLLIVPWIVWWFLVDRRRLFKIFAVGMTISAMASFLDTLGIVLGGWIYQVELIPMIPQLLPMDFSVLPIGYMLVYQYFPTWRRFLLASLITSLFGAFIVEPFFVKIDIYQLLKWKHIYSFSGYFILAVFIKWFVDSVLAKAQANIK